MHKPLPLQLLLLLLDQQIHSGEELGRSLEITRAAIWKQLQGLQALGVKIDNRQICYGRLTE